MPHASVFGVSQLVHVSTPEEAFCLHILLILADPLVLDFHLLLVSLRHSRMPFKSLKVMRFIVKQEVFKERKGLRCMAEGMPERSARNGESDVA